MSQEKRLESWKEIEAYLKRDFRTLRRWEKEEGLPVHRHSHKSRSSVYAYPSEINAWRVSRKALPEPPPLWKTLLTGPRSLAFGATLASFLIMVGNGVRPQVASAQSKQAAHEIWTGAGVDTFGSVTPDGSFLTFTDWTTGDLAIRNLVSGANRRLSSQKPFEEGYSATSVPSPDGKMVAYTWQKGSGAELRIIGTDGSGMRVLYSNSEFNYLEPAGFSPNSRFILTRLNASNESDRIALISASDGRARILKTLPWGSLGRMSQSADGNSIAYDFRPKEGQPGRNIMLLAADGSRETTLSEGTAREQVLGWSPDGRVLLFASERTGTRDLWALTIRDGKPQGQPILLRRGIGEIHPMGITRTGTFFYAQNTSASEVYAASRDWETGRLFEQPKPVGTKMRGVNRDPVWSPDGKYLAYVSQSGGRGTEVITITNVETGEERQLSPKLSLIQRLTDWSRDGRWLLLMAFDEKNREGAYAVDARGADVRTLVQAESKQTIFAPEWLPDGKSIIYYRRDETAPRSHLVVHNVETGTERELEFGAANAGYIYTKISPDGRHLAFLIAGGAQQQILGVVEISGGAPRELFRTEIPETKIHLACWSPDSRHVIFETSRDVGPQRVNPELWRIPASGGERTRLLLNGLESFRTSGAPFSLHPDGRRIAFAAREGSGWSIWALENFLPGTAR